MEPSKLESRISSDSSVVATKNHVSCDLDGEAVMLNVASGTYFSLDPVGARIWDLIQEQRRVKDLRAILLVEYDVEANRCERDLLALLQQLVDHGLVEIKNAPSP